MKHALKLSHPKCGEPDMSHVYRDADGAPVLVAMGLTITFDRQGRAGERIIRIETQ
ncbi:hypothetical protein [Sedimentitalea nanhaiensis]|nr:hypothetical protein [Sedimentitalea nanhaiensis]